MRVYKAFQRNFTPADNELLRCREISVFAKTIYLFIDSHCDAWEFSVERIAWALNISVDRARAGIRELENIGLLERERLNNAEGKKGWSVKYYLHDKESSPKSDYLKSIMEKSIMEKSIMEKSIMEKSIMENTASNIIIDREKNIEKKNIKENTPAHASDALAPSRAISSLIFGQSHTKSEKAKVDYPEAFETFAELYPLAQGKYSAFVEWKKAIKEGMSAEDLLEALKKQIVIWKHEQGGDYPKFCKHATTWLSQKCYLDELETPAQLRRGTKDYGYLKEDSMLASEWVKKYWNKDKGASND